MPTNPIPAADLAWAVAALPEWLAGEVTDWIRAAEERGIHFSSALDGVRQALEAANSEASR